MASALLELQKFKREFTRCSVCFNVYVQPKMLPCLHTFCFQCLDDFRTKVSPGEASCPLCRANIPQTAEGLRALPTNFFITRLLEMKVLSGDGGGTSDVVLCDPCSEGTPGDAGSCSVAKMFCIECTEKLCEACVAAHRKMKLSKTHQLIDLGPDHVDQLDQLMKSKPVNCDTHPDERIGFYCLDCSAAICMKCCVLRHKDHKYRDIAEVAELFRTALGSIVDTVTTSIGELKLSATELNRQRQKLKDKTAHLEAFVEQRAKMLQEEIETRKLEVLQKMSEYRSSKTEELDGLNRGVDEKLETLDSFREFCQQLKENGTNLDIARLSAQFTMRAKVLQEMTVDMTPSSKVDITFRPGTTDATVCEKTEELFGDFGSMYDATMKRPTKRSPAKQKSSPTEGNSSRSSSRTGKGEGFEVLAGPDLEEWNDADANPNPNQKDPLQDIQHVNYPVANLASAIQCGSGIQGIAVLHDKLFVVHFAVPYIDVYDVANDQISVETVKKQLVPGLTNATDITSDKRNGFLYVGDWSTSMVLRVAYGKMGIMNVRKFSTGRPNGLSVTLQANVLVSSREEQVIREYGATGVALRTFPTIAYKPHHAVEILHNAFVVASGDGSSQNVISKFSVDESGKLISKLTRQFRSEHARVPEFGVNDPRYLVVDGETQHVLAADCMNDRVVALRFENLFTIKPNLIDKQKITQPTCLCYGPNGCLFVGTESGNLVKFTFSPRGPSFCETAAGGFQGKPQAAGPNPGKFKFPNQRGNKK